MSSYVVEHTWTQWCHANTNNNLRNNNESNKDYTVVLIGPTGVGKSSLIKLFCGPSVKTSSGTESCTTEAEVFPELNGGRRQWLDTQGTDDSEMKESDEEILKKSFKALYDKGIRSCKIVWCVPRDLRRASGALGQQAKYISAFGINDNIVVWDSCLIIQQFGKLQPDIADMPGVICASKKFGCSKIWINENIMGYTCVDDSWDLSKQDWSTYDQLYRNLSPPELESIGYLSGVKVKELVTKKLDALPTFSLTFLHEKCIKCGVEGDHRYVNANCHVFEEKIHTGQTYFCHPNNLVNCHTGSLETSETKHNEWKHVGEYKKQVSLGRVIGGIFSVGISEVFGEWLYWTCCGSGKYDSAGCKAKEITTSVTHWTCCNTLDGCKQKFECCGALAEVGNGCEQRYRCCDKDVSSPPCTGVCNTCKRTWGTGPGCMTETH